MVAEVHCGDVVVVGAEAETGDNAAVGDVVSDFGLLLGIDVVVEEDCFGGGRGRRDQEKSKETASEHTGIEIAAFAFGGLAMTEGCQ